MSHLDVAKAGSSTTRQRTKLTQEGTIFLTNYARTVNSYPQKAEKEAILASLRAIPGNDSFTLQKLTSWFARHRNPSGDPHAVLLDDETILFPKLTPTQLQQLRVLYKKRADPSEGIVTFWAERFRIERAEVVAWIQYQREKAKEDNVRATPESPDIPLQQLVSASVSPTVPEFPRPHLPTPAKSLSPSISISPQTRMPSLPPIAVKVEESRQCLSPVSSLSIPLFMPRSPNSMRSSEPRSALEGLPPLSTLQQTVRRFSAGSDVSVQPARQTKPPAIATSVPHASLRVGGQPYSRDSNTGLAASIRDSLRPDASPSEQPPRTVDEFAEKFERVGNMIDVFMKRYDSGQLARLGWDPNLSRAAS